MDRWPLFSIALLLAGNFFGKFPAQAEVEF
jgi:hypothetical protein